MKQVIKSDNNKQYKVLALVSRGGLSTSYKVECVEDGEIYEFRLFPSSKREEMQNIIENIKKCAENLLSKPITTTDGKKLEGLKQPLDIVSTMPNGNGFGYVCEFVDRK